MPVSDSPGRVHCVFNKFSGANETLSANPVSIAREISVRTFCEKLALGVLRTKGT